MVRGNWLRTESADGPVEIIDLDGRRFIHVDPAKKSYWIQTFDQFKQQVEQAREKVKQEQAKAAAKHGDAQNVTMVPKFDVQATGKTQTIMNVPAKEMKMRVDMLLQSTDPKTQADLEKSNASFWMTGDAWYGTISGYDEVRTFYVKMAKELVAAGVSGNGQSANDAGHEEFKELSESGRCLWCNTPVLAWRRMDRAGRPGADKLRANSATAGQVVLQQRQHVIKSEGRDHQVSADCSERRTTTERQQHQREQQQRPATPAPVAGSMMDMTISDVLFKRQPGRRLFDVPAGYAQAQPDTGSK
jgi:hypothetical protein